MPANVESSGTQWLPDNNIQKPEMQVPAIKMKKIERERSTPIYSGWHLNDLLATINHVTTQL